MSPTWEDPPEYRGSGSAMHFAMPSLTPVVKRLLILHFGIFFFFYFWWLASEGTYLHVSRALSVGPELWKAWFPFVPFWQLLTYGFLHSTTDPFHILFNLMFLYFLGTMLEDVVGSRRFLVVYLASMLAGGVLTLLMKFVLGHSAPTVGASGAIFGVVVAAAVLRPQARIIFIIVPMTLKVFALIYVGVNVFLALNVVAKSFSYASDYFAHLGGALYAFLAARRGWIWRDPIAILEARQAVVRENRKVDDQKRVDELLERIHQQGMQSLSERDRAFLRRVSKRQ